MIWDYWMLIGKYEVQTVFEIKKIGLKYLIATEDNPFKRFLGDNFYQEEQEKNL